ncbi:MAG: hemolysin III family protein [Panacibacter sp.]
MKKQIHPEYIDEFTPGQEQANILIHILGIVFGLVAIPFLITMSSDRNASQLVSIGVYAFCFLMLFLSSTLYHAVRRRTLKMILKSLTVSVFISLLQVLTQPLYGFIFLMALVLPC